MITIIIPTYNRPSYSIRLIEFYLKFDFIKLLVLDSSDKKILKKKYFNNKNIIILDYPSSIFLSDKIIDSTSYIGTEYVVLCADDDTLVPQSIKECIKFLNNNNEYVSAQGRYYPNIYIQPKKLKNYKFDYYENNNYLERIENYLTFKNSNTLYAVHRTTVFKMIWNKKYSSIRVWEFHEFLPTIISLSIGKSKYLNILYHLRTLNNYNFVGGDLNEIYSKNVFNDFEKDLNLINRDFNLNLNNEYIKSKIQDYGNRLYKIEKNSKYKKQIKIILKFITFNQSKIFFDNLNLLKTNFLKFLENIFKEKLDKKIYFEYNLIKNSYKKTYFKEINFTRFQDTENS